MIHPTAATGFARAAGAYDRARPEYPAGAIAWAAGRLGLGDHQLRLWLGLLRRIECQQRREPREVLAQHLEHLRRV